MARTAGALYLFGGLFVLGSVAVPHSHDVRASACLTLAGVAAVTGIAVLRYGARFPRWTYHFLVAAGTVLITVAARSSGHGGEATAVAGIYVFATIDAFFFFARAHAVIHVLFAVLACSSLAAAGTLSWSAATVVIGTVVLVGIIVGWLVQLAAEAEIDALTRVANRRGFERAAADRMRSATRLNRRLAIVLFDLDGFKQVNDQHGHADGDRVLRELARCWRAELEPGQTLARLGGDEFALLLPGYSLEAAGSLAEHLRSLMADRQRCSAGVAAWEPGDSVSLLVGRADVALYRAKQSGRDRIEMHPESTTTAVKELRTAIDDEEIHVHLQPIVDLPTGAVVGVEALARWQHPQRGLIAPDDFIPLAEASGVIVELGASVLRQACVAIAPMEAALGRPLTLSVNASAVELERNDYVERIAAVLHAAGWPADRLIVEVTESLLGAETPAALAALARLRTLGARVAIDDFGTGWSSLGRLARMPVDIIKVDKSFVSPLTTDHAAPHVLTAICSLARALSLQLVAEGVETQEQAQLVQAAGCHRGQGYYYGRPQPPDTLLALLTDIGRGRQDVFVPDARSISAEDLVRSTRRILGPGSGAAQ